MLRRVKIKPEVISVYAGGEMLCDHNKIYKEEELNDDLDDLIERGFFVELKEEVAVKDAKANIEQYSKMLAEVKENRVKEKK